MDLGLDFDMDLSLDFNIGDFEIDDPGIDERTRILVPRLDGEILTQTVHYQHAEELAEKVCLEGKCRTFAWVSGSFIFGDLPEALLRKRGVSIKELYIASLSLSEANLESWAGLMSIENMMERFDLLLAGYFYSHEKYTMVPKIYEKLDKRDIFQVAFGPYHCKLMCIRTLKDNLIVIHGSANARSSNNVEHVMIDVNDKELFDFNASQIHDLCTKYGTVNHGARQQTRKEINDYFARMREKELGKNGK